MATVRTRWQGVGNIVRFNWPFYAAAGAGLALLGGLVAVLPPPWHLAAAVVEAGVLWLALGSLLVSAYVYDVAPLYRLPWLRALALPPAPTVVNINAGFDESSALLRQALPAARLHVFDFYDPRTHTEASIRRARAAYPPYPGTQRVGTAHLPLPPAAADLVVLMLAAHEIRSPDERAAFFGEVRRLLRPTGYAVVVEHLRDVPNGLAYSLGAWHFYARRTWLRTFRAGGLHLWQEQKLTPFVSVFILRPHDDTP